MSALLRPGLCQPGSYACLLQGGAALLAAAGRHLQALAEPARSFTTSGAACTLGYGARGWRACGSSHVPLLITCRHRPAASVAAALPPACRRHHSSPLARPADELGDISAGGDLRGKTVLMTGSTE